jgi:predicted transglutaminase-like cysteine proteinase
MNPRLKSVAVSILSICLCALTSDSFDMGRRSFHNASHDLAPMSDRAAVHSPAVFFSINAILRDIDRLSGRGPGVIRLAALKASNSLTDAPLPTLAGEEAGKEPFGLFAFRVPDGVLWHKWKGIEADVARDQVVLNQCRAGLESCPSHAARFLALIDAVASKSGRARLDEANHAVNGAITYVNDSVQHGEADRWSAPLLTLATGKGDCEDYAIAKYVALQEAGFSRDDMRVVLVRDRAVGQEHAVLAARIDDRWLILDNRRSELIEDLDAPSLTPLFAINHSGVRIFALPYASRMSSDTVTE